MGREAPLPRAGVLGDTLPSVLAPGHAAGVGAVRTLRPEVPGPGTRLAHRELGNGTRRLCIGSTRQRGTDQASMHRPLVLASVRLRRLRLHSGVGHRARRGTCGRDKRRRRWGRLRRGVRQDGSRFRENADGGRLPQNRGAVFRRLGRPDEAPRRLLLNRRQHFRVGRGCSVLLPPRRRHLCMLVLVVRVAGRAARLLDLLTNHCDNGVVGDPTLARTVVVEDITKPKLALLHEDPRRTRRREKENKSRTRDCSRRMQAQATPTTTPPTTPSPTRRAARCGITCR